MDGWWRCLYSHPERWRQGDHEFMLILTFLHCEFGGQEEKRKEERMGGAGSFTYEGNRAIPGSWLISVASPGTEFQSYRGRFLGSNGQPEIYRTGIPAKEGWLVR